MSSPSDYVSVEDAGKLLGVSSRTVRNWIASGKLPAISGNRGRLVARADLLRIGALTGKVPEMPEDASISERPSDASSTELPEASSVASVVTARSQLEAIRDEWLAPLVAQISDQAETIGRVTAERDQARIQAEMAALEREQIQAERDALQARMSALETLQAESLMQVSSAPETATSDATGTSRKRRQRRWWLRLFGIDE